MAALVLAVLAVAAVAAAASSPAPARRLPGPGRPGGAGPAIDDVARDVTGGDGDVDRPPGRPSWLESCGARVTAVGRRPRAVTPEAAAAWCDELARRVRSGATLREALVRTHGERAVDEAVAGTRLALERGATVAAAVGELGSRPPAGARRVRRRRDGAHHVALVLAVAGASATAGGSAAEPLDRTAATLRRRAADRAERAAQSAAARMSAHVLTVVPVVALALQLAGDPRVRAASTTPAGAGCVLVGGMLNVLGWWWMVRISEVRS